MCRNKEDGEGGVRDILWYRYNLGPLIKRRWVPLVPKSGAPRYHDQLGYFTPIREPKTYCILKYNTGSKGTTVLQEYLH